MSKNVLSLLWLAILSAILFISLSIITQPKSVEEETEKEDFSSGQKVWQEDALEESEQDLPAPSVQEEEYVQEPPAPPPSPPVEQKPAKPEIKYGYQAPAAECTGGERRTCTTDIGCAGEQKCSNEKWGNCYTQKICTPGERFPCQLTSCEFGIIICNECGSGWSGCKKV
ncbi:MAG: hypothetical protein ABIH83_03420 [Candidatus Micrarchaeota archaeon]